MVKFNSLALAAVAMAAVKAAPHPMVPSGLTVAEAEKQAGGTLPNTALPTQLAPSSILDLQVVAANELFETAYFTSLLNNVTNDVDGYTDFNGLDKDYVVKSLKAIQGQETLHADGANAILQSAGAQTIGPCKYMFGVTDFKSAIALAATFTDLVVGALQNVQQTFATDGGQSAMGLVPLFSSIIGQEGEQDGAYRLIQRKTPSAAPFLTAATGVFAYNAVVQNFIVPDSCSSSSNVSVIDVPQFKFLRLAKSNAMPEAKNQTLKFVTYDMDVSESNSLVYISGQNAPVVRPISDVTKRSNYATFTAHFPFEGGFANGLTIAALTKSSGPFANPAAVANDTVAGPGLIEVD